MAVKKKNLKSELFKSVILLVGVSVLCGLISAAICFYAQIDYLYVYIGFVVVAILIPIVCLIWRKVYARNTKILIQQYKPTGIINRKDNNTFCQVVHKITRKEYEGFQPIREPDLMLISILNINTEYAQLTNYKAEYWNPRIRVGVAGIFNVMHLPYSDGPTLFFYNKKNNLEFLEPKEYTKISITDKEINKKFDILYMHSKSKKENYKTDILKFIKELSEINNNYSILLMDKNCYILVPGYKFNDKNKIEDDVNELEKIRKVWEESQDKKIKQNLFDKL